MFEINCDDYCDYIHIETHNDGVLYLKPDTIVGYGMNPSCVYPFYIILKNGNMYNISEEQYQKFFKEKK